jgi:hypothetical protein
MAGGLPPVYHPRMSHPDLVVVRTFPSRIEAEIAQSALEADGIQAVVLADDVGGQYSRLWMTGVRLLVPDSQVTRAAEILDAALAEDCDEGGGGDACSEQPSGEEHEDE